MGTGRDVARCGGGGTCPKLISPERGCISSSTDGFDNEHDNNEVTKELDIGEMYTFD